MSETSTFKDETLSEVTHNDPDKHWIGESLAAPSLSETNHTGAENSTGTSPFVARADHQHDLRKTYGHYTASGVTCVGGSPGSVYLSNFSLYTGTELLHSGSTQLFDFIEPGFWEFTCQLYIVRSAGGFNPGAYFRITALIDNAVGAVEFETDELWGGGGYMRRCIRLSGFTYPTVSATSNIQFQYDSNDGVDHTVAFERFTMARESGLWT